MKVKSLTTNIMVDFKKVEKDQVFDLPKDIAERFVQSNLVELIAQDAKEQSPIIVIVDGNEVNLANKSGGDLAEFAKQHELNERQPKEKVLEFAERLKTEYEAKQAGE